MKSENDFLKKYNINNYDRPSVAVDIVCFALNTTEKQNFRKDPVSKLSILLIKRGEHPFADMWALPGGFVQISETVEDAALREISEETNIHPNALSYTGVFSDISRDPRGRIISNAFMCVFNYKPSPTAGTDAKDSRWFDISISKPDDNTYELALTNGDIKISEKLTKTKSKYNKSFVYQNDKRSLAFDHAQIILTAIKNLRKSVSEFELLFEFLPEKFTLTSLQKTQEAITGTSTTAANFRRKVSEYVIETGEYTQGAGHRPAMLFRKKG